MPAGQAPATRKLDGRVRRLDTQAKDPFTVRAAYRLLAVLCLLVSASGAAPRRIRPGDNPPTPVELGVQLGERLAKKQPITVAFLGDSITGGMNVPDPNVNGFPVLFARMIEERFPGVQVQVVNKGVPGNTTGDALARFDDDVAPALPNLVVLQFGGNDKGVRDGLDNLPHYQQNLRKLVAANTRIGAASLIMSPPMHEPVVDMPYPRAAVRVGQELKVPVADVDTALKKREHDYRGFFPYFYHPQEHGHAIMATELYHAFCDLIGRPLTLQLQIGDYVAGEAALGALVGVPVKVLNDTDKPRTVSLRGEAILTFRLREVEVPAHGSNTYLLPLALPHTLSGGRSLEWPLWVAATAGDEVAFSLARITAVPVMNCPASRRRVAEAPFATLGWPHLGVGRNDWRGDRDLSADIRLSYDADTVNITVDVTDDIVTTNVAMPYGDGIELYLDLRPDADRGKPFLSKQCATLFIGATADGAKPVPSTLSDDEVAPELLAIKPTCTATALGYRLEVPLPRAALDKVGGRRVKSFGLDLCVDDCDGATRKSQLIWLGRSDDFVDPRRLGEVRVDDAVPPGTMRVTIF